MLSEIDGVALKHENISRKRQSRHAREVINLVQWNLMPSRAYL